MYANPRWTRVGFPGDSPTVAEFSQPLGSKTRQKPFRARKCNGFIHPQPLLRAPRCSKTISGQPSDPARPSFCSAGATWGLSPRRGSQATRSPDPRQQSPPAMGGSCLQPWDGSCSEIQTSALPYSWWATRAHQSCSFSLSDSCFPPSRRVDPRV